MSEDITIIGSMFIILVIYLGIIWYDIIKKLNSYFYEDSFFKVIDKLAGNKLVKENLKDE